MPGLTRENQHSPHPQGPFTDLGTDGVRDGIRGLRLDAIEASTGLKLLSRIPATVQNDLEGGVDSGPTE